MGQIASLRYGYSSRSSLLTNRGSYADSVCLYNTKGDGSYAAYPASSSCGKPSEGAQKDSRNHPERRHTVEENSTVNTGAEKPERVRRKRRALKYLKENLGHYIMLVPGYLALVMFSFIPMYGLYMAFIDYNPLLPSLFDNTYMGFYWFELMFTEPDLGIMVRNTLILNGLKLLICFPAPIVLALLINELTNKAFKRVFQTVSYLPNFISWVIVSGMLLIFLDTDNGLFNKVIEAFGRHAGQLVFGRVQMEGDPGAFGALEERRLGNHHVPGRAHCRRSGAV